MILLFVPAGALGERRTSIPSYINILNIAQVNINYLILLKLILPSNKTALPSLRGGDDDGAISIEGSDHIGTAGQTGPAGQDFTLELQRLSRSPTLARSRLGRLSVKRLVQVRFLHTNACWPMLTYADVC